jgi:hypothetical protein
VAAAHHTIIIIINKKTKVKGVSQHNTQPHNTITLTQYTVHTQERRETEKQRKILNSSRLSGMISIHIS